MKQKDQATMFPSHDGHIDNSTVGPQHCGPTTQEEDIKQKLKSETSHVKVCMLKSISKFTIPVRIDNSLVEAVIDSAAEVTIISDKVYQSLRIPPKKLYDVRLDTAGRQLSMKGFVAGPVKLKIGNNYYRGPVYVAPIEQDMLFGVDIMREGDAIIDMGKQKFVFKGHEIMMNTGEENANPKVARVTIAKRIVIPPNSAAQVKCAMDQQMSDYVVEPIQSEKIFGPRLVRSAGTDPVVCIVNCTDRYKLLRKGKEVATASTVAEFLPEEEEECTTSNVCQVSEKKDQANPVPEHLSETYKASTEHLSASEQSRLAALLNEHEDVFAKSEFDLGTFTDIEHGIDTGDARPIKQRMRRTPACFVGEEEAHLKKMLEAGVIKESASDWASSPVLIRKRDGSVRWCIDYRGLNKVTVKDVFPLPLVDDCLDTLAGNVWFSRLDANSAYWQINIKPEDRHKTAFHTRYGLFEHVKMGFGLCNAPASYARVMNLVLRGLNWKTLLAFLDDVLIMGKSFDDHLENLDAALKRFRKFGLKLKPKKCIFFQKEVEFLGRLISNDKLSVTDADIQSVALWPVPACSKDVERFMGLANYHRSFIKNFSQLADPLYRVVGKKKFQWTDEQQQAFDNLKEALTSPPVLALPNTQDSFILDCDASNEAIGAELLQVQGGEEKAIAYGSYALTKEQRRYCTTRKELLAMVRFCRHFRHHLLGKQFIIRTDHSSLTWLLRFKEPQGQLARWMEELSQYDMVLEHRSGVKHTNADALSRIPCQEIQCDNFIPGVKPSDLPCGGCSYCVKADSQWGHFAREVDDAVPLTSQGTSRAMRQLGVSREPEVMVDGHGGLAHPLVGGDTSLSVKQNSKKQQSCHRISAETIGVGANDQVIKNGKPACYDGLSYTVENQSTQKTTKADWGITRSLSSEEPFIEILSKEGTVSVNLIGRNNRVLVCGVNEQKKPIQCCWGLDVAELQKQQRRDDTLTFLLDWLDSKQVPSEADLFIASPAGKYYWLAKEEFLIIGGLLYHQRADKGDKDLVVPENLKQEAIRLNHDLPSSGHQGIERTKARIKEKFFWYGMGKDITEYVVSCDVCNKNKKSSIKGRLPMHEYQAGAPMERVHIDFLGPLPKTPRGNEHILMMVDQFTKWVECVPLPSQTAEVTAKAAIDGFFSRFGYPFQIFSDQGRNFESKLFTALCEALEIHKARTTPYRASSNGQVERYNRTLMDAVRCFIRDSQDQWDLHLQQIAGALRSSVNRRTGYTANKMMLGREVNTPAYLMFPLPAEEHEDIDQFVAKLTRNIQTAHNAARTQLKTTLKRMKRDYDLRGVVKRNYQAKDIVYLLDTAVLKGNCRKLSSPWKGPAIVIERLSAALFRVQLRKSMFMANHDRLKPCKDRKLPDWIKKWQDNPNGTQISDVDDSTVYCLCREPWQGRFMIQCDGCDEWFHGACVDITPTEALSIDEYQCGKC